ncbi:hypothetical protein N9Y90_00195 [Flavobacteriales bacterium]|nr:hypothetical protein [Flavobacteriales bacterium]
MIFQKYQELNQVETDAIQAVPINAAVIIESDDWSTSVNELKNSTIWNTITQNTNWVDVDSSIDNVKNKLENSLELKHFVENQKLYLSLHHSTNSYYYFISTFCSQKDIDFILANDSTIGTYEMREYDGILIYKLSNNINLCYQNNILFFSNSELLVEDGIRQLNNNISLLENSSFTQVQSTKSSFVKTHVYVNYKYLSKLISQNTSIDNTDIRWISRWASWAELDLEISNKDLTFSGFTLVEDSSSNYLTSLFGQLEQKIQISEIAPRNTSKILALGIEDVRMFYSNYREFLAKHNNLYEHNKAISDINSKYDLEIENSFNSIIKNEMGQLTTHSSSGKTEHYLFFKTDKESQEVISFMSTSIANSNYSEEYRGFKIGQLNIPHLFKKLYGYIFKSVKNNYFTWIEGYLIFSDSPAELKAFINNFLSEKVLSNNPSFINFKDKIGTKCNFMMYSNPSIGNWGDALNENINPMILDENWTNINGFIYQLSSKNELFYNNVVLHFEDNLQEESQLDWIVDLENTIINSPQIVYNHSTRKNNVIIQDANKTTYLIDEKGKELWRKNIGGKILDNVSQIDFYKNGKLQYLFNTEDSLYVLDRLGRNVENFPVSLISKAKRGHTLVDYDKNRKYRILIPSQDGMLYNYSKNGEQVTGWKFEPMKNPITHQVKYFSVSGRDFIYAVDNSGNVSVVGRSGVRRSKIHNIPITDDFYVDEKSGHIYSSDSAGNIFQTNLNNATKKKIKTSEMDFHKFVAAKFNNDDLMDLLISDGEEVECFNLENKIMSFDVASEKAPKVFKFKDKSIIGISSNGYCHLYSSDESPLTKKPLFGGGEFVCVDLDKDGKLNLIVINENILNNYTLE